MTSPQISLQFVLGAGIGSRLISWWGNGYGGFSHVDALLVTESCLGARSDVVGGQAAGVRIRPAGYEKWAKRRVATLDVSPAEYALWEGFLMEQLGMPYDKANIFGLITGSELVETGHWICSALQTAALQKVNRLPTLPVPPSQITPNALLLMLGAIGFQISP
jgi:hypothetical protein